MTFSTNDKLKALAIVKIFETSDPFGDYAAVTVLNDGAGVSYGISQFTHRSGSLLAVAEKYLESGSMVGRRVIEDRLPVLRLRAAGPIRQLAGDTTLKKALQAAAVTREMRSAQEHVAFERYLGPAMGACEGSNFVLPLSLAVVYDSMNHGSWATIRDRVPAGLGEKEWITAYVRERDRWLRSHPRLESTAYRTRFFLSQIQTGRWHLELPLNVHGRVLTASMLRTGDQHKVFDPESSAAAESSGPQQDSAVEPKTTATHPAEISAGDSPHSSQNPTDPALSRADAQGTAPLNPQAQPPNEHIKIGWLASAASITRKIAARYTQTEETAAAIIRRKDAAKSLWTTVAGTLWQTLWAIYGFVTGLPREIWFAVAVIAAALTLFYLYRQIELGRIRERHAAEGVNK